MKLRHFRYFIAVAEAGGLKLAAEKKLRITQLSLSRQMRDLEHEIGKIEEIGVPRLRIWLRDEAGPVQRMVFMLPKGLIRHPEEGDCPYIAFSKHTKGDRYDLPVAELSCPAVAPKDTVIASTYMPEALANVNYFKSVPILPGKSIADCFAEANKTLYSLQVTDAFLAPNKDQIDLSAEDFIDAFGFWPLPSRRLCLAARTCFNPVVC